VLEAFTAFKDLDIHFLCQHLVLKMLSLNTKKHMARTGDLITIVDQDVLSNIITGDETCAFCTTHSLNVSHVIGISKLSTRKQEFHLDKSNGRVVLEIFFDAHGFVQYESIPQRRTVNKEK
jgi:hypothetical protein